MVDPTADPDALDDADLGVVDALRELKHDVDLLRGRLTALQGMQANLSDAVYRRVHEDYAQRLKELEARIAPLRAQARLAYAGLRDRLAAIQSAYASIQLDRQEVELRHQLGEYDATARAERLSTIDGALRERSIAQDRAEALRARFLEVFESEADLEAAAPPAAAPVPAAPPEAPARPALSLAEEPTLDEELAALTLDASMLAQIPEPATAGSAAAEPAVPPREDAAPAHIDAAVTQILQVLDMPDLPSIPPAPPTPPPAPAPTAKPATAPAPARVAAESRPAAAETAAAVATPPPPAAPPGAAPSGAAAPAAAAAGSTMFLRTARLVPQNVEAGRAAIPLPPKPVTLGGDPGSDIRVGGPGVEAQHARIEANNQGYVLSDLDSKHGTRVNAEPIRERLLRHEDVIQIGAARYVFREG